MTEVLPSSWVVLKFGGTSVSSRESWTTIAEVMRQRLQEGLCPVIVHSALAGVSDLLDDLVHQALHGTHERALSELEARHRVLATDLDVAFSSDLSAYLSALEQVLAGIRLLGEATPRACARVLATGELLATSLGAAFLKTQGLPCAWMDARVLLQSLPGRDRGERAHYLAARCDFEPDTELQRTLADIGTPIVTQGFIARDARGDTVLLGRGGSDVSAAYLAARLEARRLENWTDVPGMFSADPRRVSGARLLRTLDYAEAQEIATTGGAVLHPRSIPPLRQSRIPLQIRCTPHPDLEGTEITAGSPDAAPRLKAISIRRGLTLISLETTGMWHQVGFLADAFARFAAHGVSVDLVSTSETSVTVSVDQDVNPLDDGQLEGLIAGLEQIARVRVIDPCAAVSLVGRQIRAILHRLGPALELFEEHRVHLVSQAASDLNLTFVVDEDQADRLVQRLHGLLIHKSGDDAVLGPTWEQLFGAGPVGRRGSPSWWVTRADELLALAPVDTAAYVYDLGTVDQAISGLQGIRSVSRHCYAIKANAHPGILERIAAAGLSFECVSTGELDHLRACCPGLEPDRVLFTPNFASRDEYERALAAGVLVTLDNLYLLEQWGEMFASREVFVRLDPGAGRGHHRHVQTAGNQSKFGVPLPELTRLAELASDRGVTIAGLHVHAGSGILDAGHWSEMATLLAGAATSLPDVRVLNLGGGLGVPDTGAEPPLDLGGVDESLSRVRDAYPDYELWLEPGRYLVAAAGVLLTRVTQTKGKGEVRYVGVNTGMNSLIRPALYGSHHEIVNLSRLCEPATQLTDVVGPICETGDVLGTERLLPETREDDVMLVANAGAYGAVMSSSYNLRPPAVEMILAPR